MSLARLARKACFSWRSKREVRGARQTIAAHGRANGPARCRGTRVHPAADLGRKLSKPISRPSRRGSQPSSAEGTTHDNRLRAGVISRRSEMADGKIRIGIGGWTYPPWRGVFYPTSCLRRRSSNMRRTAPRSKSTRLSTAAKPKSWALGEGRPGGLPVRDQGSRYCVSRSKLAESGEGIARLLRQGFAALGPKLGPILWQFAHFKRFDRDDIAGFIDLLPRDARRHRAPPRNRAAARKLPRREVLRPLPGAQHRDRA